MNRSDLRQTACQKKKKAHRVWKLSQETHKLKLSLSRSLSLCVCVCACSDRQRYKHRRYTGRPWLLSSLQTRFLLITKVGSLGIELRSAGWRVSLSINEEKHKKKLNETRQ